MAGKDANSEKEIDLIDIFMALWADKWVFSFPILITMVVGFISLILTPNIFVAKITLKPLEVKIVGQQIDLDSLYDPSYNTSFLDMTIKKSLGRENYINFIPLLSEQILDIERKVNKLVFNDEYELKAVSADRLVTERKVNPQVFDVKYIGKAFNNGLLQVKSHQYNPDENLLKDFGEAEFQALKNRAFSTLQYSINDNIVQISFTSHNGDFAQIFAKFLVEQTDAELKLFLNDTLSSWTKIFNDQLSSWTRAHLAEKEYIIKKISDEIEITKDRMRPMSLHAVEKFRKRLEQEISIASEMGINRSQFIFSSNILNQQDKIILLERDLEEVKNINFAENLSEVTLVTDNKTMNYELTIGDLDDLKGYLLFSLSILVSITLGAALVLIKNIIKDRRVVKS